MSGPRCRQLRARSEGENGKKEPVPQKVGPPSCRGKVDVAPKKRFVSKEGRLLLLAGRRQGDPEKGRLLLLAGQLSFAMNTTAASASASTPDADGARSKRSTFVSIERNGMSFSDLFPSQPSAPSNDIEVAQLHEDDDDNDATPHDDHDEDATPHETPHETWHETPRDREGVTFV